ncbi:Uncharacterised protein [uncultured archaeon]|nr:Uncharacterised protein [uncultured archaeon]
MTGDPADFLKASLPKASKWINEVGDQSVRASIDVGIIGESAESTRKVIADTIGPMKDLIKAIAEIENLIRTIGKELNEIKIPHITGASKTANIPIPKLEVTFTKFDKGVTISGQHIGISFDYPSNIAPNGHIDIPFEYMSYDVTLVPVFKSISDKFIATADNIDKTVVHLGKLEDNLDKLSKDDGPLDHASKILAGASNDLKGVGGELKKINISD